MVLLALTLTFSTIALQVIAGAVAAALTGRAMTGGGYGLIGDILFGIVGAIAVNFIASTFNIFNISQYGTVGQVVLAIIGSVLLVVIVHLITARRTAAH
jgi:uncharacterized membrane protein YeaQ/YmgE (transglycosylase-associated protein family)